MLNVLRNKIFMVANNCLLMLGLCTAGMAEVPASRAVGWHWYNEIPLQKADDETKDEIEQNSGNKTSAVAQMAKLRQAVEEAKARAVLYPTVKNLRAYILLQNFVTNQATLFTQAWKKALLVYPELDYSILHPTQNSAQHILYAQNSNKENEAIATFGKKYGLFFFYRGKELLDQELAKTIDSFSRQNKIALVPIAMDGRLIELFDNSQINRGQAEQLGIKHFPALVLVEPKSKQVVPLHYGFIAESELRRRFLQVATNFKDGV